MPKVGGINGNDNILFVIKCVHEMQEVRVIESITSFMHEDDGTKTEEFYLEKLNIASVESAALFGFLSYITNLQKLWIKDCRMQKFAFRELAKLLIQNNEIIKLGKCKLTGLKITNCGLTHEGTCYLSDALKSDNCKLTELNISDNELADAGARYISDALKSDNCKLTHLNIGFNVLGDEGARYLSDAMKSDNCKLTLT